MKSLTATTRPDIPTIHYGQGRLLTDGTKAEHAITAGVRYGKALALDTPIPTIAGFKNMGDIQVGDVVFDETGTPCHVTDVSPVYPDDPCYRVVFDNAEAIVASADHLWVTSTHRQRANVYRGKDKDIIRKCSPTASVVTTKQIHESIKRSSGWANHSISCAGAVQWPEQQLVIPPYTLGAWLGDGFSAYPKICGIDQEIMERIKTCGYPMGAKQGVAGSDLGRYTIGSSKGGKNSNGFLNQLRELGLLNNKHIPEAYLKGSIGQRLELLRGLMDTDGHVTPSGQCEFTSKHEHLARDLLHLVTSLGSKGTVYYRKVTNQTGKYFFTFKVVFFTTLPVFALSRKLKRLEDSTYYRDHKENSRTHRHFVREVIPVAPVPTRCISVDSPNKMYLAGRSFIPTHNSSFGPKWHFRRVVLNKGSRTSLVVAPTYKLAKQVCLNLYLDYLKTVGMVIKRDYLVNLGDLFIEFPWLGHRILFLSGDNPDAIVGFTSSHAWVDEAALCSSEVRNRVLQRNSFSCPYPQTLYTTTPEFLNWFYDVFGPDTVPRLEGTRYSETPSRLVLHGRSHDNPYLSRKYLKLLEEELNFDPAYYQNYVLGEWVSLSHNRFYYNFRESEHVGDYPPDEFKNSLILTWDENVDKMSWAAIQKDSGDYWVVADNGGRGRDIPDACEQFVKAFPPAYWRNHNIEVYGDAVLHRRSTLTYSSGFDLIETLLKPHYPRISVKAPRGEPSVNERKITTNRLLSRSQLKFNRKCSKVIESVRKVEMDKTGKPKKGSNDDVTHSMEAVDMALAALEPTTVMRQYEGYKY